MASRLCPWESSRFTVFTMGESLASSKATPLWAALSRLSCFLWAFDAMYLAFA